MSMKIIKYLGCDNGGNKMVEYLCNCGKTGRTRLSRFRSDRSCRLCFSTNTNRFNIIRDIVEIDVSTKKFPKAICTIDLIDINIVLDGNGRWFASDFSQNIIYAVRSKKNIRMHRKILEPPDDNIIDHKDGNGLNNRRNNIWVCDYSQNAKNQRLNVNNKTGVSGVYIHTQTGKFCAQGKSSGKRLHLGCFDNIEDARTIREMFMVKHGFSSRHGTGF